MPSKAWSKSVSVVVNVKEVDASRVEAYRVRVFDLLKAIPWRLYLPGNRACASLGNDFGKLPSAASGSEAYVPAEDPSAFPEAVLGKAPKKHWREWLTLSKMFRLAILIWFLILIIGAVINGIK
jgi:hypothetical protein